jgi:hypothetical protein
MSPEEEAAMEEMEKALEERGRAKKAVDAAKANWSQADTAHKQMKELGSTPKALTAVVTLQKTQRAKELKDAEAWLKRAQGRFDKAHDADNALRGDQEGWNLIHRRGFYHEREGEDASEVDATKLTPDTLRLQPIFNEELQKQSSHRMQGCYKAGGGKKEMHEEVKRFEEEVVRRLDSKRWRRTASGNGAKTFKNAKDAYALYSVVDCEKAMKFVKTGSKPKYGCADPACPKGCAKQRFHGDSAYPKAFLDAGVPWGDVPLIVFQATQDNTVLHVRPFNMDGEEEPVTLNAGDRLWFRGNAFVNTHQPLGTLLVIVKPDLPMPEFRSQY